MGLLGCAEDLLIRRNAVMIIVPHQNKNDFYFMPASGASDLTVRKEEFIQSFFSFAH